MIDMRERRKVNKFDKMARKYIKLLHLRNDPEQFFYDELAHFILMWDKKQYFCKLIRENIEKSNVCYGECDNCEFRVNKKQDSEFCRICGIKLEAGKALCKFHSKKQNKKKEGISKN